MVDAHAHMDKYGADLPRALEEIRARSLLTLAVSMDVSSYRETLRIAELEPLVIPSFGIHPWNASHFFRDLPSLDPLVETAPMIGEIGLDHFFVKDEEEFPAQRVVFEYFLDAAARLGKLINVHTKGAETEVADALEGRDLPGVILHWYSGSLGLVDRFLEMGAYFTVGVEVLGSSRVQDLARNLPLDRLLTETDNPGGWEWMEGSPGFPHLIERVQETIGEVRGVPADDLEQVVQRNMEGLLRTVGLELMGD
ncbi:TatD family hydrolase [Gemmatimonadota bacterium]